jgi:hypothetical protein
MDAERVAEIVSTVMPINGEGEAAEALRRYVRAVEKAAVNAERDAIAEQTRLYASYYPQGSDSRNTFLILAHWIEARKSDGRV